MNSTSLTLIGHRGAGRTSWLQCPKAAVARSETHRDPSRERGIEHSCARFEREARRNAPSWAPSRRGIREREPGALGRKSSVLSRQTENEKERLERDKRERPRDTRSA